MIDAALARRVKLVGFDVDGVLTDNGVYVGLVGDHPVEFKRFYIQDGLGIRMLRSAGLLVVWASARRSDATELRARELKVDELVQDNRSCPLSRPCSSAGASPGRKRRSWATTCPICRCSRAWASPSPSRTQCPKRKRLPGSSRRWRAAKARCARWPS